ncbi:MAG: GNAT family N-acetyltransferase [Pelolinea sp.]|nr:GNAT family N-acetyltransferase [Pelolinea sp.]
MPIKIRKMETGDYSGALSLWQSLPGLGLSGADKEDAIFRFLEKNPETCFVAQDAEKIIGTVLGGSDSRRGYLYHLSVHKDYQRLGLGRQISEKCLAALKAQGLQKCHIFVIGNNLEGLKFWEKLGWLLRNDILVMSKNL